jgi:hypothetical protein
MGVAYGFVEHLNELKNNIGLYYCVLSVEKLVGFNATHLRVFGKLYGRIDPLTLHESALKSSPIIIKERERKFIKFVI